uniref:DDE Tnp4 domain-containing protein n=1 Tax=Brassica oleracea var. oleracea TaxID=109376 RepID=A0A0D3BSW9_BRAOL
MASSSHYHYHNESDDDEFDSMAAEFLGFNDPFPEPKERKKRIFIERDREEGHRRLWIDYFSENPTYSTRLFRPRFRMNKSFFMGIVHRLSTEIPYFRLTEDATGRTSLSPLQKCTAAIRQLAYGEDLERLLHTGDDRGFPGMIGSIDCMHWEWKNCPTAWKGMYSRGTGKPTIVLEAVASKDLWIWHAFFGAPGTMNDLNILDRSPVFDDIINGVAPQVNYYVNGTEYHLAYYLTDGIYPKWATFIQSIRLPQTEKQSLFATYQESVRKDVERAFGVLQARFAVVKNPSKLWDKEKIGNIMKACIILHNMIVEDERDSDTIEEFQDEEFTFTVKRPTKAGNAIGRRKEVRDSHTHQQLKKDLIEHIWDKFGHFQNNNM